ncbi:MAG: pirin family protein [Burkholderiaceae bacterium]|nr:pirin family protein [Burkholderiaceae bacterium]
MTSSPVLQVKPLGFPWETADPFLFCAYHDDAYPRGNGQMGPAATLAGREIGQGDAQWLTAGGGVVHSEMFPLLDDDKPNPLELFQIWLNLPAKNKMAPAHFTMFWGKDIPRATFRDEAGRETTVSTVAGQLAGAGEPLPPPPDSWAAQPEADVAIWTVRMAPGARWTLPAAAGKQTRRTLYFFKGRRFTVGGQEVTGPAAISLQADVPVELISADDSESEFLLLQGRPIAEPVAQYGPFVMNTQAEVMQTMQDYRRTQFGGWPWPDSAPVHGRDAERFARHPNGRKEVPA